MCNFNAPEMLRRRRLTAQDMTISPRRAADLIAEIDEARWHHFEETGCCCWDKAREASMQSITQKMEAVSA
jgi:hypothetical protein